MQLVDKVRSFLSSIVLKKVKRLGKKRKQQQVVNNETSLPKKESLTLADQLGGDILNKLKEAKKELTAKEQAAAQEREAQLAFERKQREKNKTFEELLNEYGDQGSKF